MLISRMLVCIVVMISMELWTTSNAKTASRGGLVATSTFVAGSKTKAKTPVSPNIDDSDEDDGNSSDLTALARLRNYLMKGYDSTIPPVLNFNTSVKVKIDIAYRQVLDLDEKNQILTSLIWFRQYWKDELLVWTPEEHDGISETTLPASSLWRPDIAVYEEVGSKDYSPRLPYATVDSDGNVMYAEPSIMETTCAVNTAFFPFDTQLCHVTFVSWTQPITHIDLRAKRDSDSLKDTGIYIDSGEWVLQKMSVRKQVLRYNTEAKPNVILVGPNLTNVPATQITEPEDIEGNSSSLQYAELRYTVVIQRNSGLYMQSMLFPSILLTSVALFGFYLPPDSGERVGLQITILLTFMVFLLTVGEMFPASTGPYIGIYFVLSMAQLGVNILMTITVLHIHFKPCERDIAVWRARCQAGGQPESMIPVKLRRFLQFCDRHFKIADKGVSWMKPIANNPCSRKSSKAPELMIEEMNDQELKYNNFNEEPPQEIRKASDSGIMSTITEGNQFPVEIFPPERTKKSIPKEDFDSSSSNHLTPNHAGCAKKSKDPKTPRKDSDFLRIMDNFRSTMKGIVGDGLSKNRERDEEEEMEESVEREQEEWKSVARAVDKLFFRLYLFLMFVSYFALVIVAIHATLSINAQHAAE